jgi:hypothetical protein
MAALLETPVRQRIGLWGYKNGKEELRAACLAKSAEEDAIGSGG